MQRNIAGFVLIVLVCIVIARVLVMRRAGVDAMQFGKIDKTDFMIPPFALLYFYTVFAHSFNWPSFTNQEFFHPGSVAWLGVILCMAGMAILIISVIAFGSSFRVGIDTTHPDRLITSGIFSVSRNPIYVGFWIVLLGEFLIFPNWLLGLYLVAATWLFHRQVVREETFLRQHYGEEYSVYCSRVRRYF